MISRIASQEEQELIIKVPEEMRMITLEDLILEEITRNEEVIMEGGNGV